LRSFPFIGENPFSLFSPDCLKIFLVVLAGRGKDRSEVRSREVWNETKDQGLRGDSNLFFCLICKRISPSLKDYPILVTWHMDSGYFFR
jgi:hypothetical protein